MSVQAYNKTLSDSDLHEQSPFHYMNHQDIAMPATVFNPLDMAANQAQARPSLEKPILESRKRILRKYQRQLDSNETLSFLMEMSKSLGSFYGHIDRYNATDHVAQLIMLDKHEATEMAMDTHRQYSQANKFDDLPWTIDGTKWKDFMANASETASQLSIDWASESGSDDANVFHDASAYNPDLGRVRGSFATRDTENLYADAAKFDDYVENVASCRDRIGRTSLQSPLGLDFSGGQDAPQVGAAAPLQDYGDIARRMDYDFGALEFDIRENETEEDSLPDDSAAMNDPFFFEAELRRMGTGAFDSNNASPLQSVNEYTPWPKRWWYRELIELIASLPGFPFEDEVFPSLTYRWTELGTIYKVIANLILIWLISLFDLIALIVIDIVTTTAMALQKVPWHVYFLIVLAMAATLASAHPNDHHGAYNYSRRSAALSPPAAAAADSDFEWFLSTLAIDWPSDPESAAILVEELERAYNAERQRQQEQEQEQERRRQQQEAAAAAAANARVRTSAGQRMPTHASESHRLQNLTSDEAFVQHLRELEMVFQAEAERRALQDMEDRTLQDMEDRTLQDMEDMARDRLGGIPGWLEDVERANGGGYGYGDGNGYGSGGDCGHGSGSGSGPSRSW